MLYISLSCIYLRLQKHRLSYVHRENWGGGGGGFFGRLRVPRKTDGNNAAMTNFADVLWFDCVLIQAMVI